MKSSIVKQLIWKDLQIMRIPAICYWLGGLGAIAFAIVGGDTTGTVAFILFVSCISAVTPPIAVACSGVACMPQCKRSPKSDGSRTCRSS